MKIISVKSGDNKIGFTASLGACSADAVCKMVDVVSDTNGTVTLTRKVNGFDTAVAMTTVTVASNVGQSAAINVPICAGDTITVSGTPVGDSAKYSVRLVCE